MSSTERPAKPPRCYRHSDLHDFALHRENMDIALVAAIKHHIEVTGCAACAQHVHGIRLKNKPSKSHHQRAIKSWERLSALSALMAEPD